MDKLIDIVGIPANVQWYLSRDAVGFRIEDSQRVLDNLATLQHRVLDKPMHMLDMPAKLYGPSAEDRYPFCPSTWSSSRTEGKPASPRTHQAVLPGAPDPVLLAAGVPRGLSEYYTSKEQRFIIPCNDRHDQVQLTEEGADLIQMWRTILQQQPVYVDNYLGHEAIASALPIRGQIFAPSLITPKPYYSGPTVHVPRTAAAVWSAPSPFSERSRAWARWAWIYTAPFIRREDMPGEKDAILGYSPSDRLMGQPLQAARACTDGASIRAYPYYVYPAAHARKMRPFREFDMKRSRLRGRDMELLEEAHAILNELGDLPLPPALATWAAYEGGPVDTYAGEYPSLSVDPRSLGEGLEDGFLKDKNPGLGNIALAWNASDVLAFLEGAHAAATAGPSQSTSEGQVADDAFAGFRWWREVVKLPALQMASGFFARTGYRRAAKVEVATDQTAAQVAVSNGMSCTESVVGVALGLIPSVPSSLPEIRSIDQRFFSDLGSGPEADTKTVGGRATVWTAVAPLFTEPSITDPSRDVPYYAIPAYADMGARATTETAFLDLAPSVRVGTEGGEGEIVPNVGTTFRARDQSARVLAFYTKQLPEEVPGACRPRYIVGQKLPEGDAVAIPQASEPYSMLTATAAPVTSVTGYVAATTSLEGQANARASRNIGAFIVTERPSFFPRYPVRSASKGVVYIVEPLSGIAIQRFQQDGQAIVTRSDKSGTAYDAVLGLVTEGRR